MDVDKLNEVKKGIPFEGYSQNQVSRRSERFSLLLGKSVDYNAALKISTTWACVALRGLVSIQASF
jgi:hypothetical protein